MKSNANRVDSREPDMGRFGLPCMSRAPEDGVPSTDTADAELAASQLREQLEAAKARMREHRETMLAAGLARPANRNGKGESEGDETAYG